MHFSDVCIESIAYSLPPERWSSEAIEEKLSALYDRLNLPYGRLELMTGIKERRFWPQPVSASEASALAAEEALAKSNLAKGEIDLLAHTAVCRDRLEPATAAYVHQRLGLSGKAQVFDLSNACLGFLNAMTLAGGMIQSGQIRNALIVAGENGKPLIENTINLLLNPELTRSSIKPYFANLTIGAGAVAAVLCHSSQVADGMGLGQLLAGVVETDTRHNELCEGDAAGENALQMQTDSEELLNAGIGVAGRAWEKFKKTTGWSEDTPDRIITHQVGRAHQRGLFQALNLDSKKDFSTYEFLGNVGSVSLPITLALALEKGAVAKGDKVALLGIGSGLSSMMLALQM